MHSNFKIATEETINQLEESCGYEETMELTFDVTSEHDKFVIEIEKFKPNTHGKEDTLSAGYRLIFLYPATSEDDDSVKTWDVLEKATNIKFRSLLDMDPTKQPLKNDYAILEISNKEVLRDIINLCEDIANSLRLGGIAPEDAGDHFLALFTPETATIAPTSLRDIKLN
jgi:hypothetical protein